SRRLCRPSPSRHRYAVWPVRRTCRRNCSMRSSLWRVCNTNTAVSASRMLSNSLLPTRAGIASIVLSITATCTKAGSKCHQNGNGTATLIAFYHGRGLNTSDIQRYRNAARTSQSVMPRGIVDVHCTRAGAIMFEGLRFNHEKTAEDDAGIVTLGMDRADSAVNAISRSMLDELDEILERLEIENPPGVILHSCKSGGFAVGADIREFVKYEAADTVQQNI